MNLEDLNLSEETNDVLTKQPKWIVRSGNILVFAILIKLFILSLIIKYNDVIKADIVITSKNPPVNIIAKSKGILTHINAIENQNIAKGDILAVIENNANFSDIKFIKKYLKTFAPELKDFDSLNIKLPPELNLGDVQTSYNNFRLKYQNYLNYLVLTPEKNRIDNYTLQMLSKSESLKDHTKRIEQYQIQLDNEEKKYLNNQKLYKKGIISELDYLNSQNALSKAKEKYQELKSNLEYEKSNLLVVQNNLKQSSIKDKSLLLSSSQNLMQSRQELINDIRNWEQKYILSSPINGKLTLFDVWNQYQDININDVVFTIIPNDLNGIVGRVLIPITNSGKLKQGQNVLIKIENYPYQEWGKLRGTISSISSIPKEDTMQYTAIVELDSLVTTYNRTLDFKQKMKGQAEIIVDEISLFERLLYPLKEIFETSTQAN